MISGKVLLSTGMPPPEPVAIQRVCGSRTTTEGYTDSKGRFQFTLGERLGVMPDASDTSFGNPGGMNNNQRGLSGDSGERALMNCELRANLAGYRSQTVSLAGKRSLDDPEVGTIIMHRIEGVEGLTISATTAMAPKDAKKAYDKGRDRLQKGKAEEAQADFQKAVEVYPKFAMAWLYLGITQEKAGGFKDARKSYDEALKIDSKLVQPYLQLAGLDAKDQNWEQTAINSEKLIRLDPVDYPYAYYLNAGANLNLHKLDEAEKSARQGLKMDEQHKFPALNHVLGMVLLQKAEYAEAATNMRAYLDRVPNAPNADAVKKQIAEADKLGGKTEVVRTP